MKEITIDCAAMLSREDFHDILAKELALPHWYGRNLDALHDLLAGVSEETHIRFLNWSTAEASLGRYAEAARKAIGHAAFHNARLTVEFR